MAAEALKEAPAVLAHFLRRNNKRRHRERADQQAEKEAGTA